MKLKIAEDLSLPVDVVTQTIAVLAKRRAGKSYTMRRLVEQLFTAGQQVVLVDPKGDQWGIRSAADGKGPGLPFVILGGERGDVPLEPGAGALVAKLIVEERVSAVIDLSLFRKREVARFMGGPSPPQHGEEGFLEVLYRLKAQEKYRTPITLVLDEADAIAPQKPDQGEERMLGAAEDIVRRGGQRGLGCVFVTQRSAVLNKNVLTQAEIMVALRTIAPQDLAAMNAWIDVHGTAAQKKTLMESLPSLPVGDAWFWSPGWPTADGIFKRVHVLPIETFDSGATPKPGEKRREPKTVADVDLDALKHQMSAAIEKSKADDPRELRKRIAELEKDVAAKDKVLGQVDAKTQAIEAKLDQAGPKAKEALSALKADLVKHRRALEEAMKILVKVKALQFTVDTEEGREELHKALVAAVKSVTAPIEKRVTALVSRVEGVKQQAHDTEAAIQALLAEKIDLTVQIERREPFAVTPAPAPRPARVVTAEASNGDAAVGKSGLRRMLIALAQRPKGLSRSQLGLRATVSSKGGSFDTYLSKARVNGWIDSSGERIQITDAGVTALGHYEPLPEGQALLDHYLNQFGSSGAARMLRALADAHPRALSRAELSEASNVSAAGGSFDTYLSKLRTLELIEGRGELKASDELFN